MIVRTATFRLTAGRPRAWSRTTRTGDRLGCWFCPDCGTRLWHQGVRQPGIRSVKGGSLDRPPDLTRVVHIHTDNMLAGIILPEDAVTFPGEPPGD